MSKTSLSRVRAVTIRSERTPGLDLTLVDRGKLRELNLALYPLPNERPAQMLWRLDGSLRKHRATVVKHDIFGSLEWHDSVLGSMKRLFGKPEWPVTWVEGKVCRMTAGLTMNVMAVSGTAVDTLRENGRPVGRVFDDGFARHCLLTDVRPSDFSDSRPAQAGQVFHKFETLLRQAGMTFGDIVRTWFFMDGILSWYGAFNEVRTEIFTQRNLFPDGVPASTGVGVRNRFGAAVLANVWAVRSRDDSPLLRAVNSPLQCAASRYGSCFSRAMELRTGSHRRMFVSGTASISREGRSARPGDPRGQVSLTMQVVEAMLVSREFTFSNVTRSIAYFKNTEDAVFFDEWRAQQRCDFPVISVQADICRKELLFEIELDAMAAVTADPIAPSGRARAR